MGQENAWKNDLSHVTCCFLPRDLYGMCIFK